MAELALSEAIFGQTCFHAQQAAENGLKGFLVARVGTYPKGHSLEALLLAHESVREELWGWRDRVRSLDRYYLPTRYPDALPGLLPEGEPTETDAREALRDAVEFVADIRGRIGGPR